MEIKKSFSKFVEFFKTPLIQSAQTDEYANTYFKGAGVQPTFLKSELLNLYKTSDVHSNCINKTAAIATSSGFSFDDEESMAYQQVKNLIDNLQDKDGNNISFANLCRFALEDYQAFGEFSFEKTRLGDTLSNLFNLSTKNLYTNKARTELVQINSQTQQQVKFEFNRNAENEACIVRRRSCLDDFYGVPRFVASIPRVKTIASKMNAIDSIIEEMASFSWMFTGIGGFTDKTEREQIIANFRTAKSRKGGIFTYFNPDPNVKVELKNLYDPRPLESVDTDKDEIKIMAAHDMTPDVYGYITGGGITSGEKATGAFKLWVNSVVLPLQTMLAEFFNNLFKIEFGYTGKLTFNLPSFDTEQDIINAELTRAQTYQIYKQLGNLMLINEYRKTIGYDEITVEEWEKWQEQELFNPMPTNSFGQI